MFVEANIDVHMVDMEPQAEGTTLATRRKARLTVKRFSIRS